MTYSSATGVKKTAASAQGARLGILIVEDSVVFRDILRAAIGGKHEVYVAADTVEGWAAYYDKSPHIVFMDIELPHGSGHDLAQLIKQHNPETYIVMATGSRSLDDKLTAAQNHVDGFIVKPFQMKDITACIERYQALRRKAGR